MRAVISFLNGKGGTGKTTTAVNVATGLARKGFTVTLVDTDEQQSALNWHDASKSQFDVVTANTEKSIYAIRERLKYSDYVIIDGAAGISAISAACVLVSDVVIIPVSPSPLDFSACGGVLAVIEARSQLKPVVCRFLLTKRVVNASMTGLLRESIEATGIPALRTELATRQSYVKSLLDGGTIYSSNDHQARGEIDLLINEILELSK